LRKRQETSITKITFIIIMLVLGKKSKVDQDEVNKCCITYIPYVTAYCSVRLLCIMLTVVVLFCYCLFFLLGVKSHQHCIGHMATFSLYWRIKTSEAPLYIISATNRHPTFRVLVVLHRTRRRLPGSNLQRS
jgi:hypothetical protein